MVLGVADFRFIFIVFDCSDCVSTAFPLSGSPPPDAYSISVFRFYRFLFPVSSFIPHSFILSHFPLSPLPVPFPLSLAGIPRIPFPFSAFSFLLSHAHPLRLWSWISVASFRRIVLKSLPIFLKSNRELRGSTRTDRAEESLTSLFCRSDLIQDSLP